MDNREKILVVRVGRGGDMVMITPALNALLDAFPDAEVHLLTSAEGRRVLRGYNTRLTHTWIYERRFPRTRWLQRKLVQDLEAQRFTRIFAFESDPRYRRLLRGIAPEIRTIEDRTPGVHYCDRCVSLVQASTGSAAPKSWVTLPVTDDGVAKAQALLTQHGFESGTMLVGLHPTFSGSSPLPFFGDRQGKRHRNWPQDSFAQLARRLQEEAQTMGVPLRIVIDALLEELTFVEPIAEKSGGAITLLTAPPDFERYKALLQRLDVLVTPNTGPMHIAAAVGTRLVALFSGWSLEDCGPYVPAERYEVLRAEDTHHPEQGLAAIDPEEVCKAVFRLLPAAEKS